MPEKQIEIATFEGVGYKPLVDFNNWRVAFLRFIDELLPENIERLEKHLETAEVFVLLTGKAILFIGKGNNKLTQLTPYHMEPYKLYTVKQGTWHNVVLSKDATILLVENQNTCADNSAYCYLNDEQRLFIQQVAKDFIPDY